MVLIRFRFLEFRRLKVIELNDFFNDGSGWVCRQCDRDLNIGSPDQKRSRIFTEGEAESKVPVLANRALAKWTDKTRRFLTCPRCGVTEAVDIS
jgi:hypothetical protein